MKGYCTFQQVWFNFRQLVQAVGKNRVCAEPRGLEGDTVKMKILNVSTCPMWLVEKHHVSKKQTRSRLSFW